MTQNIGDADRVARMLVAGTLAILFFQLPRGLAATIVGLASVILFVAGLSGWSLLYFVLRRSTRSDKDVKPLPPA